MRRRRFSERDTIETLSLQGIGLLCYRCNRPMLPSQIEREHITELALGGKDEPENCAYSHKVCHAIQTNGTPATSVGSSKQRIAKTRRLERQRLGMRKPKFQRRIASRGFPKPPLGYKHRWPKQGNRREDSTNDR